MVDLRANTVLPLSGQPLPPFDEGEEEGLVTETVEETV
jgi:hypothetical protein